MRGTCPVCEKPAKRGPTRGDRALVECEDCGTYQISGTALTLLENGELERPDPKRFKALVEKKRGGSEEYPWITQPDLEYVLQPYPGWRVMEEPDTGGWTRPPGDSWTREPYDD